MSPTGASGAISILTLAIALGCAGCEVDHERSDFDTTMNADGYALVEVENEDARENDVTITVRDADPGATYALLYSHESPRFVGWFQLDPASPKCGSELRERCEVQGYGHVVDLRRVLPGTTEVALRGRSEHDDSETWRSYWAVLRIEPTNRPNTVHVTVVAKHGVDAGHPKIFKRQ